MHDRGLLPLGEAKQSRRLASRFARRTFAKAPTFSLGTHSRVGARLARRAAVRRLFGAPPFALGMARVPAAALRGLRDVTQGSSTL